MHLCVHLYSHAPNSINIVALQIFKCINKKGHIGQIVLTYYNIFSSIYICFCLLQKKIFEVTNAYIECISSLISLYEIDIKGVRHTNEFEWDFNTFIMEAHTHRHSLNNYYFNSLNKKGESSREKCFHIIITGRNV